MDRRNWLEARQLYIGATDITRLLGIAPSSWGGPYAVWRDKVQSVEDGADSLDDYVFWGHRLEPVIAAHTAERFDMQVDKWDEDYISPWPHKNWPRAACSPDYYVGGMQNPQETMLVECKNVSAWKANEWGPSYAAGGDAEGHVPEHYLRQVHWQIGCTGTKGAYLCALIGGNDYRYFYVKPDRAWFQQAAEYADAWYAEHVVGNEPPAPDHRSDLVVGQPLEQGMILTADDELEELLHRRHHVKCIVDSQQGELDKMDARLCAQMGDAHDQVNLRDGTVAATWKTAKNGKRRFVIKPWKECAEHETE